MSVFKRITKCFISDADRLLRHFSKTNTPTQSQKAEIEKHTKIAQLRDHPHTITQENIWQD